MHLLKIILVICAMFAILAFAAHSSGQGIGEKIDKGVNRIGEDLKQTWQDIRRSGEKMTVNARVHARLYWDKAVHDASIDIDVPKTGTVVLKGSVPTTVAKAKAVELAKDTVGVNEVVDELVIGATVK